MGSVLAMIRNRTFITDFFRQHGSPEGTAKYLADWEDAHALLGERIIDLRALLVRREREKAEGRWPA